MCGKFCLWKRYTSPAIERNVLVKQSQQVLATVKTEEKYKYERDHAARNATEFLAAWTIDKILAQRTLKLDLSF